MSLVVGNPMGVMVAMAIAPVIVKDKSKIPFMVCSFMHFYRLCVIFIFNNLLLIQWNPVNTDTKGTCQNVRIIGVSVLSGFPDKKSRTRV